MGGSKPLIDGPPFAAFPTGMWVFCNFFLFAMLPVFLAKMCRLAFFRLADATESIYKTSVNTFSLSQILNVSLVSLHGANNIFLVQLNSSLSELYNCICIIY